MEKKIYISESNYKQIALEIKRATRSSNDVYVDVYMYI